MSTGEGGPHVTTTWTCSNMFTYPPPSWAPQTCSNLFSMWPVLSTSGRLAIDWNAFLYILLLIDCRYLWKSYKHQENWFGSFVSPETSPYVLEESFLSSFCNYWFYFRKLLLTLGRLKKSIENIQAEGNINVFNKKKLEYFYFWLPE